MSYTTPTDVQTKADAVLALASTIAGEDKTALGNGSVNKALDVLADVLAQQDVQVPQTNAGAILALAQYVTGGGGSSDFTTANVAITNNSGKDFVLAVPNIYGGTMYSTIDSADIDGSDFTIILYGSGATQAIICSDGGIPPTASGTGGVSAVGIDVNITGDGTLTFS